MNLFREFSCFFSSVAQSQSSKHITFGRNTDSRTTSLTTLLIYLFPQNTFCMLHVFRLRIRIDLGKDLFNLLQLQINNIIHDTLRQSHMLLEQFKIKISIRSERIDYV